MKSTTSFSEIKANVSFQIPQSAQIVFTFSFQKEDSTSKDVRWSVKWKISCQMAQS